MSQPSSTALVILLCWSTATLFPVVSPHASAQETRQDQKAFSGPQPGERLPPLTARIVIGEHAGEEVELVSGVDGKPVFLIFMNDFGEVVNEAMRVMTLYAEQQKHDDLVTAVVWLSSDAGEMEARLDIAKPHMPRNTPVGISLAGPEGPGAYGLNRHVQMTILVAHENVVTANFALVQPSIQADSVAVLSELAKVIGRRPPTLADVIDPRNRQIVSTRIELMLEDLASDNQVRQQAKLLENFVHTRPDAKTKLGQMSQELVEAGEHEDRTTALEYLRKWAQEYEQAR